MAPRTPREREQVRLWSAATALPLEVVLEETRDDAGWGRLPERPAPPAPQAREAGG